jgi:hypothetical protein
MDRFLNALFLVSLALILSVLNSIRRAHIRVEYSVSWLLAALLLLVLSRWGVALRAITGFFGAGDEASSLLMVAGCIFLVVLFRQSLRISGLKDSNIALTQRVAILEYRLGSLDEKVKTSAAG